MTVASCRRRNSICYNLSQLCCCSNSVNLTFTHYSRRYLAREFFFTKTEKYIRKLNAKYGLLSIDAFDNEDDNGTDYIQAETEDVAETVAHLLLLDKLRLIITMLKKEDQDLIQAMFYEGLTERQYAERCRVNRNAVHKRKVRILAQIKKLLEN